MSNARVERMLLGVSQGVQHMLSDVEKGLDEQLDRMFAADADEPDAESDEDEDDEDDEDEDSDDDDLDEDDEDDDDEEDDDEEATDEADK